MSTASTRLEISALIDSILDELLSAQSEVLKFSSPPIRVRNALTGWLDNEQCLVGLGEKAYFEDHKDLVALRPAKGEDRLSQFLRDHCSQLFKVSQCNYWLHSPVLMSVSRRDVNQTGNRGIDYIMLQRRGSPRLWACLV